MKKHIHIFFILVCLLLFAVAADCVPAASAASSMAASEACVEFIKTVEGFSPKPYFDYNQYTVGYGTECPQEDYDDFTAHGISRQEAERLLREELEEVADSINRLLIDRHGLSLTQHQFDALVSFSFNLGTNWLTYNSTLRHAILNHAGEEDFVYAFSLYCTAGGKYLPGLVTRRLCEANMFLNDVYSQTRSSDHGYVYYDANGGTVTYRVQGFVCDRGAAPIQDAARKNDVFLGWYTDINGGKKVSTLDGSLTGKTLFARWQSSGQAENQDTAWTTVKVTGDAVNIRSGPGTTYGITGRVYRNEVIKVSHVTHLTNMKWGKLNSGWICLDYTNYDSVTGKDGDEPADLPPADDTPAPDTQAQTSGTVRVSDFLRVRSGPGTAYATVGFLFDGNTVHILEQKTAGAMTWGRISDGWVCMDYIVTGKDSADSTAGQEPESGPQQPVPDAGGKTESVSLRGTVTADALRIRSGPGTETPIVGFYYQDDPVVISEKAAAGLTGWGKTARGWISMDYVRVDSSGSGASDPLPSGTKTVTADCLRIRKDAGTDHKIVGFLYDGDTVTILETKTVSGTLWGRISKGWICMQYTK